MSLPRLGGAENQGYHRIMGGNRKGQIRVSGLVRMMNHAREQLAEGIPAPQHPEFRRMVTDAVRFVERVCREYGGSPDDLPAPSRRAYKYLKALDLEDLPISRGIKQAGPTRIRISNLISSCRDFQRQLAQSGRGLSSVGGRWEKLGDGPDELHSGISALAAMIDEILARADAEPSALPDPSRRAYQWLKYLSDARMFREHVRTLARFYESHSEAHIELYNMAGLFRARTRKGRRHVTISEAFTGAPRDVIRALVVVTCIGKDAGAMRRIREYAHGEEYREASLDLEWIGVSPLDNVQGVHYDLGEIFARVNKRYFGGRMKAPVLTWNKTITHGKFGHYVPASDTVMISIALDSDAVPGFVIEHVMHHELLHRTLGVKFVDGRRIAHSSEFRAAEREFEGYQQAQEFLGSLSASMR